MLAARIPRSSNMTPPRVVIVGAGFGGLSAAKALAKAPAEVLVIDRKNHHLFQPLLYQVATAGLAPTQIANPIRSILGPQANARVILSEVTGVDLGRREVVLKDRRIGYDQLVLATGAAHSYFGHDDWAAAAPGLKTLDDALDLRRRILLAFERAELEQDPDERARLLTFVVIGAGPTGVELAGAIAELAQRALARDFRAIRGHMAKVVLVEAGPRVLPSFPAPLSAYAAGALEKLGVGVRLGHAVTGCDAAGVELGGERIEARTVIWAAGVKSSPAAHWTGAASDPAGRAVVAPDLSIPGAPEVFVVGDAARLEGARGPLPGLAPVAKQEGAYVGRLIERRLRGRRAPGPFRYLDSGALATIGRQAAVVAMGALRLTGFPAWLLWSIAHIYFLIGFRNRLAVTLDWAWAYLTFERGARLITGRDVVLPEPSDRDVAAGASGRRAA
jgi:NADH dehydrogenase